MGAGWRKKVSFQGLDFVRRVGLVNDGSPDPPMLESPCGVAERSYCFEKFWVSQDGLVHPDPQLESSLFEFCAVVFVSVADQQKVFNSFDTLLALTGGINGLSEAV